MKSKKNVIVLFWICSYISFAQVPNYVPVNGLQGYWPFTGNANDISVNGYNGIVNGASLTTDRFNVQNCAYSFNGNSSIVTSFQGILGASPRAVAFWAKTSNSTVPMATVGWGNNTTTNRFNTGFNAAANGACYSSANNSIEYTTPSPVSNNVWHHYVFQFSNPAFNQLQVYQDGILLVNISNTVGNITAPFNTTAGFNVCFGSLGNLTSPPYFTGQMDDIGIWNRVLTKCEILQLYNSSLSTVNLSSSSATICSGKSTTISALGASSYTWVNLANIVSNSVVVSPTVTTSYMVLSDCGASNSITVFVAPNPLINITSNINPVCWGQIATLTANGGVSYVWNLGSNGSSIFVSPPGNTTYTVTGTDIAGCAASAVITQSVFICNGLKDHIQPAGEIILYPNPTPGMVILKCDEVAGEMSIYNATGDRIVEKTLQNETHEIDLSAQPKGIYFVKISFGYGAVIKKVIKE